MSGTWAWRIDSDGDPEWSQGLDADYHPNDTWLVPGVAGGRGNMTLAMSEAGDLHPDAHAALVEIIRKAEQWDRLNEMLAAGPATVPHLDGVRPEVDFYLGWNATPPTELADGTWQVSIYGDHKRVGWAIFPAQPDAAEFHSHLNGPPDGSPPAT